MKKVINKNLLIMQVIHALTVYLFQGVYALTVYLLRINGLPTGCKAIYTNGLQGAHIVTCSYYPVVNQLFYVDNPKP